MNQKEELVKVCEMNLKKKERQLKIMKYLKHYRAGYGMIPSLIFSFVTIIFAAMGNDLWIITITLSFALQIYGVRKAKKYYEQLEDNNK